MKHTLNVSKGQSVSTQHLHPCVLAMAGFCANGSTVLPQTWRRWHFFTHGVGGTSSYMASEAFLHTWRRPHCYRVAPHAHGIALRFVLLAIPAPNPLSLPLPPSLRRAFFLSVHRAVLVVLHGPYSRPGPAAVQRPHEGKR